MVLARMALLRVAPVVTIMIMTRRLTTLIMIKIAIKRTMLIMIKMLVLARMALLRVAPVLTMIVLTKRLTTLLMIKIALSKNKITTLIT